MYSNESRGSTTFFSSNSSTSPEKRRRSQSSRRSSFKSFGNAVVNDRTFGAKWITDLELSWKTTERLTLAVGANNLFNVYPDRNDTLTNVNTGAGFYATSGAYGFTGGYYYGRVAVDF